jgi:hypothetical protein
MAWSGGNLKQHARARTRASQEKENIVNLQLIVRAAVCAALVVVCLAGAGWFPSQRVAGQEVEHLAQCVASDQQGNNGKPAENFLPASVASGDSIRNEQAYRPGLRNSFVGHPLNAKELNLVLAHLKHKTGFVQMRFDEAGFLTIDDRSQIAGGSAAARKLLLAAVDGKKSINLQSHNRSPEVSFAQVGQGVNYMSWRREMQIAVEPIEIDFADFNHLRGERKVVEAFDPGFVILHELCHTTLELRDLAAGVSAAGDCETYVNRIRRELGMPERQHYAATAYLHSTSMSRPTATIARLVFTQKIPGREPESRAKTKTLHLRWDVQQVGNNR